MDVFDPKRRSEIMRRVRSSGTTPEMIIRGVIRRMKVKYRSCSPNLPGKPDLVLIDQQKVILVHGCFWHGHRCEAGKLPKSNRPYWKQKQFRNTLRDSKNLRALRSMGWKPMIIWECEIRRSNPLQVQARLSRFLKARR